MANFVRRLRRESRVMVFAQSLGAIIFGFLAWSGLLILLDLYVFRIYTYMLLATAALSATVGLDVRDS